MQQPIIRGMPAGHVLVRCASHRARNKATLTVRRWRLIRHGGVLTEEPMGFFSWQTNCTGGFIAVPEDLLLAVLAIKGCSRASSRFTYQPCWHP